MPDRLSPCCTETTTTISSALTRYGHFADRSTWMPVTEAMYLLEFSFSAQGALLEMIERRALQVLDLVAGDMSDIRTLMKKYEDLSMDFADATLVHVANRGKIREVFTLDRRDFGVYRLERGDFCTIVPEKR